MARIRYLKPAFFDHEGLGALTFAHRLAFAGLWTQADKAGRLEDRPLRLKARIFPYDTVDMEKILDALVQGGFVTRYAVGGRSYLAIPSWPKHQRPRRDEPESELPAPGDVGERASVGAPLDANGASAVTGQSPSSDGAASPKSLGNGELGMENGELGMGDGDEGSVAAGRRPAVTHSAQDLAGLWNRITTPPIAGCRELSKGRRRLAQARLAERSLDEWEKVFLRIQASRFCRGDNDRGWVASFDWVLRSDTAIRVLEGRYDSVHVPSRRPTDTRSGRTGPPRPGKYSGITKGIDDGGAN